MGLLSEATSLPVAVGVVPLALALGTAIWLYAWRRLPERAPQAA